MQTFYAWRSAIGAIGLTMAMSYLGNLSANKWRLLCSYFGKLYCGEKDVTFLALKLTLVDRLALTVFLVITQSIGKRFFPDFFNFFFKINKRDSAGS